MQEALTWPAVKAHIDDRPRGAGYQLAKLLDMNSSYFYRKLKGRGDLTERQAQIVRRYMAAPDAIPETVESMAEEARPFVTERARVPLYGYAAGADGELVSLAEGRLLDWVDLPSGITLGAGDYFAVQLIGSSMEPRIFAGEKVVVRRNYPPGREKDVVVEFNDGTGLIKTYVGRRDGRILLRQYNQAKVIDFDATTIKALHAVYFPL